MSERADKERVMADDKKETMAIALRERIGSHVAGRELSDTRIKACQEIISRDPGSAGALEPTIDVWRRIRSYHIRTIDDCRKLLKDLGQEEGEEVSALLRGA